MILMSSTINTWARMKTALKHLQKQHPIYLSSLAILLAASLNFIGSEVISSNFPNRPVPADLFFRITPQISWAYLISDLANLFSFFLVLYYMLRFSVDESPRYLLNFALAYFLRACMIILTPLGTANGSDGSFYGVTIVKQLGTFPSGHTIMVCLAYLLIDRKNYPLISNLALLSIGVEVISLLTSRGHYSIDIVGGFLVAYFSYGFLLNYKNRLRLIQVDQQ